ncbi:cell envelope integrity protein TolA [Klebsiella pneumoniae]|uniref:cell envelope integrity protein TolA n=1 Tax=Klebsiella pneumoniae TaxID=573 RepID=UPI0021D3C685|nr:cell envelope integrity protein TolA [Klebsiella pneumoniae]MCU6565820.1 cell envelope integrity protein TolA [Klebsiella pneumoniae]
MSGTQITASTLVNKIVYRTDLNSLKKARNDMKKLQQEFSKSNNQVAKVKQQADKQIHQAQIKQQRDIDKQQKQAAKQAAVDAKAKQNEQKKLAAAQSRAAKIQMQQQAKTAKISENARLAERKALFDIGRLQGLNGAERFQAIKHAQGLIDSYKNQTLTLRDLNQQLSQYLTTQRAISRNNAKRAKQSGKGKKSGSSGWLSRQASAFIPGEILGPTAAAYAAQQAYQIMAGTLAGAIERNQGRKMISSMGGNPLEADAARMETLKRTGFSMSYEKYSDISKDTQDKIGQLSLGQWTKDKQGKASFSGGGEMSDWLQIMVNRGGYSQEGALKTLQNIKGPVELAVLLKSLQKSAKLTESEFTALAEVINDFSYLAKSVDASGQNVIDTMNTMVNSGLALNSQQQKSIDNLSQMSIVFDNARSSLGDQFAASFSKGLEDLGINTQNLSSEMGSLVPLVKDLGMGTAQTVKGFKDLLDVLSIIAEWKNKLLGTDKPEEQNIFQQGATFVGESLLPPGVLDMASRIKNIVSPGSDSSVASQVQSGGWYNQMMPATPAMSYQPVIPDLKADFNLTVNPSPEFGMMVEAVADKRIEWAFDDQNFQINQSILGE